MIYYLFLIKIVNNTIGILLHLKQKQTHILLQKVVN